LACFKAARKAGAACHIEVATYRRAGLVVLGRLDWAKMVSVGSTFQNPMSLFPQLNSTPLILLQLSKQELSAQ
jgi:hypothetical protein